MTEAQFAYAVVQKLRDAGFQALWAGGCVRDQLLARWPKNQPEGMVCGGAELVNVMFDEDFQVLAVMDWEQPSLGGPLNGRFVDPMRIKLPRGRVLDGTLLAGFDQERTRLDTMMIRAPATRYADGAR